MLSQLQIDTINNTLQYATLYCIDDDGSFVFKSNGCHGHAFFRLKPITNKRPSSFELIGESVLTKEDRVRESF